VAWVLSSAKARRDAASRQDRIVRTGKRLDELAERMRGPKSRLRTPELAQSALGSIFNEGGCEAFFEVTLTSATVETFRQDGPGRRTPNTRYRREEQTRIESSPASWSPRSGSRSRLASRPCSSSTSSPCSPEP